MMIIDDDRDYDDGHDGYEDYDDDLFTHLLIH